MNKRSLILKFVILMKMLNPANFPKLIALILCIIVSNLVFSQMSGNYTIGGSSSGSNFATWADFAKEFNTKGVSGAVKVTVMSDATTTSKIELVQNSSNPTTRLRPLVIEGNNKILSGNTRFEVISLNGVDFVDIKHLKIENISTNVNLLGIRFYNGADSNTIDSCTIDFTKLTSFGASGGAYIAFAAVDSIITRSTSSHNGIGNLIRGCVFSTSTKKSPGPKYAVMDQQGSSVFQKSSSHNTFLNNRISNFYSYAFYFKNVNGEQCLNNQISRSDAASQDDVDTSMIVVFVDGAVSTNRSFSISGNKMSDLPFKGANPASNFNYISTIYGVKAIKVFGSTKYPAQISQNEISRIAYYFNFFGINTENSELIEVIGNKITKIQGNGGYANGIYINSGYDFRINQNQIRGCDFGKGNGGNAVLIYAYNVGSGNWNTNEASGNILDSTYSGESLFAMPIYYNGNWVVSQNQVTNNFTVGSKSYIVGIQMVYVYNSKIYSNLIAGNYGDAETYNLYVLNYNTSFTTDIYQNTIYDRDGNNSNHTSYMVYLEDDSRVSFVGNILDGEGAGSAYIAYLSTFSTLGDVSSNSFQTKYGSETWAIETSSATDFAGWVSASSAIGQGNIQTKSKFVDVSKMNFKSRQYRNQNNVKGNTISILDLNGKKRNFKFSDRGAIEDSLNIEFLGSNINFSDTVCSGETQSVSVWVKNHYLDTITEVAMTIELPNNQITEKFKMSLPPGDTSKLTFKQLLSLSKWGDNIIKVYIDQSNDYSLDDSIFYEVYVKSSPGGSRITGEDPSSGLNKPIYGQYKFDVTIRNLEVKYDLTPPRGFTNNDYGSNKKWTASTVAKTASGRTITGSVISVPSGSTNLKWKFTTSDTTLDDSFVTLNLTINNKVSGCDTLIQKVIYINPTPKVEFSVPTKLCTNDTLKFINQTKLKHNTHFFTNTWKYGTGNTSDSSIDVDGQIIYSSAKNYTIELLVTTLPYPFYFAKTKVLTIIETPKASFIRSSGCEGQFVEFKNTTNISTSTMTWNFGNGRKDTVISSTQFNYLYSKTGNYTVLLKADNKGCVSEQSLKVAIFEQPKADFTVAGGNCVGSEFTFTTTTKMTTSLFGVRWDFNESGGVSTLKTAKHAFSSAGSKTVKLVVNSEFGCIDSIEKKVTVLAAPEAKFTASKYCVLSPTFLQNTTGSSLGVIKSVSWLLDNKEVSTNDTLSLFWNQTGVFTIKLLVTLENGCIGMSESMVNVKDEVKPDFIFLDKCSGDSVHFENKTIYAGMDSIYYNWNFGNNQDVYSKDANYVYNALNTTVYNVTLTSILKNGCSSELVKQVNIFELPKTCDFEYVPDYATHFYGAKFEPKDNTGNIGGRDNTNYQWIISGVGNKTSTGTNGSVVFQLPTDGTYNVSMIATTDDNGCTCEKVRTIVMNRADVTNPHTSILRVYPNPSTGGSIAFEAFENTQISNFTLVNGVGQEVPVSISYMGTNKLQLNTTTLSPGVYHASMIVNGEFVSVQLIISNTK